MCAHQMISENLAISAGCTCSGPSASQLRLPLTVTPSEDWVPITSSRLRKIEGHANQRSSRCGIRVATSATGTPIATQVSCRKNQW